MNISAINIIASNPIDVLYGSNSTVDTPQWLLNLSLELIILELIVHPVSILIAIFNFILVINSALLHTNLKWILLSQSVTVYTSELSRFIVIVAQVPTGNIFARPPFALALGSVYVYANTFRIFISYVLLAERTFATIMFRNYEQYDKVYLNIGWIIVVSSLSYVVQITQNSSAHDFNNLTLPSIIVIFALQCAAILLLLHNYIQNKARYNGSKIYTLKQRFQLSENIRTLKQLGPTFVLYTLTVVLVYGIKFLFIFGWVVNDVPTKIAFMFQTLLLAGVNIGIELTVITHHPMLKRKAIKWILNLVKLLRINRVGVEQNLPIRKMIIYIIYRLVFFIIFVEYLSQRIVNFLREYEPRSRNTQPQPQAFNPSVALCNSIVDFFVTEK